MKLLLKLNLKLSVFFAFLLMMFVNEAQAQLLKGSTWAEANEAKKGKITVVYYPEDAFAYKDRQGKPTGVQIDILSQFAVWLRNAKGVELDLEFIEEDDFEKLYGDVKKAVGGVFGAGNITITDARKTEVRFSPAYLNNVAVLVTHSSAPDLKKMDQISVTYKGFNAVVHKGTTHLATLNELKQRYMPSLKITTTNSDSDALNQVIANPTNFTYTDLSNYWIAQKEKKPIKRQSIGDKTTEQFGFIMPLSSDWEPLMKEFFALGNGYRSNITYKKILMRHLGSEVTQMLEMAQAQNNK